MNQASFYGKRHSKISEILVMKNFKKWKLAELSTFLLLPAHPRITNSVEKIRRLILILSLNLQNSPTYLISTYTFEIPLRICWATASTHQTTDIIFSRLSLINIVKNVSQKKKSRLIADHTTTPQILMYLQADQFFSRKLRNLKI